MIGDVQVTGRLVFYVKVNSLISKIVWLIRKIFAPPDLRYKENNEFT